MALKDLVLSDCKIIGNRFTEKHLASLVMSYKKTYYLILIIFDTDFLMCGCKCVHMCTYQYIQAIVFVWKSEDNFCELIPTIYHVVIWDYIQAMSGLTKSSLTH